MKKLLAFVTALTCVFALAGCGGKKTGPGRPITAYIDSEVTTVEISHIIGGQKTQWTAEGAEVDALREWTAGLQYEYLDVEEGASPGDSDGGEVYDFVLTQGAYPGLSYVINGGTDCYLLIEGQWYTVLNPSDPPVSTP